MITTCDLKRCEQHTTLSTRDDKESAMADNKGNLFIGTSGWNYKVWKDGFYRGVKQKEWLQYYASRFNAVEVNATFYRLLKESTVAGWHEKTPADFSFAVKGSRYITHTKKLKPDPDSVAKQRDNLRALQDKISAVIWQLPASLNKDPERLEDFANKLKDWPKAYHVLEFRDQSWFDRETAGLLAKHNLANCISDAGKWPRWDEVTGSLAYFRLHGKPETYDSVYSDRELEEWAAWIKELLAAEKTVHVYFDNTDAGAAVDNALKLQEIMA